MKRGTQGAGLNLLVGIRKSFSLLEKQDTWKIVQVISVQFLLSFLDLLGVILLGLIGALSISGVSGTIESSRLSQAIRMLGLESTSLQMQVAILGAVAGILLCGKTALSILMSRRIIFFLSYKSAEIATNLIRKIFRFSLNQLNQESSQQRLYSITTGTSTIMVGVIGMFVSLINDFGLLVVLVLCLFLVDPIMALTTTLCFGVVAHTLWRLLHERASDINLQLSNLSIKNSQKILEAFLTFRELTVRNRKYAYAQQIGRQRVSISRLQGENTFLPNISKYVLEIAIVVIGACLCAYQFLINPAIQAIGILSMFLAATSRIAPAILRIQQSAVQLMGSLASANPTFELIEELKSVNNEIRESGEIDFAHQGFTPSIEVRDLHFIYSNETIFDLKIPYLMIEPGSTVAIVGPSGSGKSTLADILMGVLEPNRGSVKVSGLDVSEAISRFNGAIGYVPQQTVVVEGSIAENIALGFEDYAENVKLIEAALKSAKLYEFVQSLPEGIHSQLGENGFNLSGGQKQRLGIARALYTNPKILVMDEATSSLDALIEEEIVKEIFNMKGDRTIVLIAHRLSSIRRADKLVYLERGRILSEGDFLKIRTEVKNFDKQARALGL